MDRLRSLFSWFSINQNQTNYHEDKNTDPQIQKSDHMETLSERPKKIVRSSSTPDLLSGSSKNMRCNSI